MAKAKKRVAARKKSSKRGKATAKPAHKMAASQGSIQRVELNTFYYVSIYCPFCGAKVVDMEAAASGEEVHTSPCRHTLFEKGIDGFTDEVAVADAIKFASYVDPPSGFGSYVGFAPLEEATG